jgi:molybdenum cofactor cytidylyltransferase
VSLPQLSVLIPAAGASTRLGQPKQLVRYKAVSLIQNAVNTAQSISPGEIIVVTGANAEAVKTAVRQTTVRWAHNPCWSDGMGSSIAAGTAILSKRSCAVMILLCDQWRIQTSDLQLLAEVWLANPKRIVCAQAGDKNMPPVIFPASLFSRLKMLKDDIGARHILKNHAGMLTPVATENAAWDLDLESHLQHLDSG